MNTADWEAFTERAAILEYEAGLNRRAATLRALELCFPGDYRECMKMAGETPEGETALYEYLADLIKTGPQTHEKGPGMSKENPPHGAKAPENPPQGRETRYRGFERMAEYARGKSA